jgi:hypothetical protein
MSSQSTPGQRSTLTWQSKVKQLSTSSGDDFTNALLAWWRTNGKSFPAWALAARVAFAISPNSAACERVFALVTTMFGDEQMALLADTIQAALMLRSNKRIVG